MIIYQLQVSVSIVKFMQRLIFLKEFIEGENKEWWTRGHILQWMAPGSHHLQWNQGPLSINMGLICVTEWVEYIIIAVNLIFMIQCPGATFIDKVSPG